MALLQVQVLEVVSEQVQVLGRGMEVVIDGDAECVEVGLAVGRRQVFQPGGGDFPESLRHGELLLSLLASSPTADGPDDGHDDEEGEEDALDDDQLPGGVDPLPVQLLALQRQSVSVNHLPEQSEVQLSGLRGGGHKVLLGGGGPNFLQGGGGGEVVVHGGGIAAVQALASLVPIVIALPRCTILKQKEYFLNICQIFLAKIGHHTYTYWSQYLCCIEC